MTLTDNDIVEMRNLASRLKLDGRERLLNNTNELIKKVCNGIGPEWFPPILRNAIDKLHPSLKVVAMIHDLDYYFGDGTTENFNCSNSRFAKNGVLVADGLYSWYNPRRYIVRHSSRKFAALCAIGGRIAYNMAIRDRESGGLVV